MPTNTALKPSPPRDLWAVSVITSTEAEEALAEALTELTGHPVTSCHNLRKAELSVTSHCPTLPAPPHKLRRQLQKLISHIQVCGLNTHPGRITIRKLRHENWAESWKKHFPALEIRKALLIKPKYMRRTPREGQALIELDPGLSFGTGHHPTTRFCLEELARNRPTEGTRSMLDIGTGSGLLAIAAAKLGYHPIHACDHDPQAIHTAQANARHNRVIRNIQLNQLDLTQLTHPLRPSHIVCANLQADLLLDCAKTISQTVLPAGHLVLAGILRSEMAQIRACYQSCGFRWQRGHSGGEWTSSSFTSPPLS